MFLEDKIMENKKSEKLASKDPVIGDKSLQENRENMNLSNDQQGVVGKNINLSLTVKDKDNTVPFNVQLDKARKNAETEPAITEAHMDKKEVDFNSKDKKQVMDINVESQKYDNEKINAHKKAEGKKDTAFWDEYVGVQLGDNGYPTKVPANRPESISQLQNRPGRFKDTKVEKLVMASIKDADAMIFHIYATAFKNNRDVNKEEEQQIVDINSGKTRLIAQMVEPFKRCLDHNVTKGNPIIKEENGITIVVEPDGTKIDEFSSCDEARANYPEGDQG